MASDVKKRILCVGLCCIDIINVCDHFPGEDSVQRSVDYSWQRGGNAANSCTVLSLLGADTEFIGTLVKTPEYEFIKSDFAKYNINIENCEVYDDTYRCPVAVVIINLQNGSRTVVAALDNTVELQYPAFEKLELRNYSWIHFEGRDNMENTRKMMEHIIDYNKTVCESGTVKISIELEKPTTKNILVPLMQYADYTFVSKDFAACFGHTNKEDTVKGFIHHCKPGGVVICAWGEDGAAAYCVSRGIVTSPVFSPDTVIDTLGAGDTFNVATVLALTCGKCLKEAITYGCRVAGAKCAMNGYDGLKGMQVLL